MVPASYSNYFLASAGAAAALIGLLFVAIAIDAEHTVGDKAPIARRTVAGSAFTALVNAFFISLGALLPGYNLGAFALVMSLVGLGNTGITIFQIVQHRATRDFLLRRFTLILASLIIYGLECFNATHFIANGNATGYVNTLSIILIAVYGLALSRAWELLGAQERGLRGIIESLRNKDDQAAV